MNIISQFAPAPCGPEQECAARNVFAHITPAMYADLRRLARCLMRGERADHTLQPTAVVNEALLRLSRADVEPRESLHLFRLLAQTMRRVLVDHARERKRLKRGVKRTNEDLDTLIGDELAWQAPAPLDFLDVDAALDQLAHRAPRAAELVELRYFAGLEDVEISELYGVSRPTVEREFRFAKAFLVQYGARQHAPMPP